MKKHKKILKNFNFAEMVKKANFKGSELNQRIQKFELWKLWHKYNFFGDKITFNKEKYCFEFSDSFDYNSSTECSKKYIGDYIYNNI